MNDTETILFANEEFYRAFDDQDSKSMDRVWSQKFSVCCVHPGWGPIFVRTEIIKSWLAIMTNPESPKIRCLDPKAEIYGDIGVVVCFEELSNNFLIATNIFHREGSFWKMIHHQAGPTTASPRVVTVRENTPIHKPIRWL